MGFKLKQSRAKAALALASNVTELGAGHEADLSNPHVVTKAQIGLGNVDNTSDADKPVSTATQLVFDEIEAGVSIVTKTANYTILIDNEVILCDATSGIMTITMPSPSSAYSSTYLSSRTYNISKIDSSGNVVTIVPSASETIGGGSSFVLAYQNEALSLVTDGTNWYLKD